MQRKHRCGSVARAAWIGTGALAALVCCAGCQSDLTGPFRGLVTANRDEPSAAAVSTPQPIIQVPLPEAPLTPVTYLAKLGPPTEEAESQGSLPLAIPLGCGITTIDLETALRLGGADNPTIALAREVVQVSLADQLKADVLLLPTLNAGTSYDWHRGTLLSPTGIIRDETRQSVYLGAGAGARGSITVPIPGVSITAQLADALFEPVATRQTVTARRFDVAATQNNILLDVAVAYFELAGAEARLAMVRQSESEYGLIADTTAKFSKTGQGQESDAQRARSELKLLQGTQRRIEEEEAVAAAELARLLNVDPSWRLQTPGGQLVLLQLVDPNSDLEPLVQVALANNPGLRARNADVVVNETRLRKENWRPFVPFLSIGYSAGGFGGGGNNPVVDTQFGHFGGRTDVDVIAFWSLQNFGLGNLAIQRRNRALVGEAVAEQERVANDIRRAVAEALALCRTRLKDVDIARRRVATAQEGYRLDLIRTKNLECLPIEVLNNLNLLFVGRLELVRALAGYNQAQFQLLAALGQTPVGPGAPNGGPEPK